MTRFPDSNPAVLKSLQLFFLPLLMACSGNKTAVSLTHQDNSTKTMNTDKVNTFNTDTLVLGGGCFWCTEAVYKEMKGIVSVTSGYSGGLVNNPSYREVCEGRTGHAEVVELVFDSTQTSLEEILTVFWRIHDPTTLNRQGNDEGTQYRSVIFCKNDEQKSIAEKSKQAATEAGLWDNQIVTEISPLINFFPAEDYHQDYFDNNPSQPYCVYVVGPKVEKFRKLFKEKLKSPAAGY